MEDFSKGTTFACFHKLGKLLVLMERLIMWVSGGAISFDASLIVLVSMKSVPVAEEFLISNLHSWLSMASFIWH